MKNDEGRVMRWAAGQGKVCKFRVQCVCPNLCVAFAFCDTKVTMPVSRRMAGYTRQDIVTFQIKTGICSFCGTTVPFTVLSGLLISAAFWGLFPKFLQNIHPESGLAFHIPIACFRPPLRYSAGFSPFCRSGRRVKPP